MAGDTAYHQKSHQPFFKCTQQGRDELNILKMIKQEAILMIGVVDTILFIMNRWGSGIGHRIIRQYHVGLNKTWKNGWF